MPGPGDPDPPADDPSVAASAEAATIAARRARDERALLDVARMAERAIGYAAGLTEAEFADDPLVQDAVSWCLIVIGEASNRLSAEATAAIPQVPWRRVVDMRHRLIHQYHRIRLDIVWQTVRADLVPMVEAVQGYVARPYPVPDAADPASSAEPSDQP